MYQRAELFSILKEEDISPTLSACRLLDKQEYTESEADRFQKCRELIEQGLSYKQAAAYFRRIDKNLKHIDGEDQFDTAKAILSISELIALACKQCDRRISLKEAAQILDSCGLPDKEQYEPDECDRFLEACELMRNQNKTCAEVAAINSTNTLIEEINELLNQVSFTQAEQIRAMLPGLAKEQLEQIKLMFWQKTMQRLRQHSESGDLEAEIRAASSNVLNSGNSFGLLTQYSSHNQNQKNLLGSSTNASINE